jgi:hypothetical protein
MREEIPGRCGNIWTTRKAYPETKCRFGGTDGERTAKKGGKQF